MPTVVLNIEKKFDPNLQKLFLREQNQTTVDEDDDQGLDNHELLLHFLVRGKETAQQRKMIGGTGATSASDNTTDKGKKKDNDDCVSTPAKAK